MKAGTTRGFDNDLDRVTLAEGALLHEFCKPAGPPVGKAIALALMRTGNGADDAIDRAVGRCSPSSGYWSAWARLARRMKLKDKPLGDWQ